MRREALERPQPLRRNYVRRHQRVHVIRHHNIRMELIPAETVLPVPQSGHHQFGNLGHPQIRRTVNRTIQDAIHCDESLAGRRQYIRREDPIGGQSAIQSERNKEWFSHHVPMRQAPPYVLPHKYYGVWTRDKISEKNKPPERRLAAKIGCPTLDIRELNLQPLALRRRLIRRAIETVKGDLRGIEFAHVEAILAIAASEEGHGRVQIPGVDAIRSFEWLRLAPLRPGPGFGRNFRTTLIVPGATRNPADASSILTELIEKSETSARPDCVYTSEMGCIDWQTLSGQLDLRNWRPGDQYQPLGQDGEFRIKELFQQKRVPLWERRAWPVITAGDEIVWSRRFGPARQFAAGPQTRVILTIREQPGIGMMSNDV